MDTNCRCASIDSCIILRILIRDIPEQAKKVRDLFLSGADFYVDDAAIMETVHVMTKQKYTREEITDGLLGLLRNSMFIYDRNFYSPVFEMYLKHPSLSFDDCILARRAEFKGCIPLWTFDRKLANQSAVARRLA